MSFKCSVFGHSFGDPVVDREREEAGSEVVITIRETQTCSRCGEERVVSENKEVTTLETPDEPADAAAGGDEAGDRSGGEAARATAPGTDASETVGTQTGAGSPDAADANGADADPTDDAGEPTDATATTGTNEGTAVGGEAAGEMDDATIIEESPEESIVEEAEPEEPTVASGAPGGAGGTTDSEAEEDDAVILEDEAAEETNDEDSRQPGEWPEEPDDDGPQWEPPTDVKTAAAEDVADEQATTVEPTGEAVTVPEGTFQCPECGYSTPVESSSLRAGDFCPDCHTGTLVHEAEE